ncbi:MFS general substrate transporter [Glarea lozoyensis ATCC 20868]|uniref:MFS general substrate transporter n=1 Tax=Glarea lozoyensis (strain ATCC 20868 / MF5171) TaxID=1116229 RepID=S3CFR1_GLAL2|nr:MFS general substrate transporter [Glarea lozoyensis ATCC 20868]EPE25317.1 MFS general substrate transporter [Glarea lozoyensis ATCC 20868]
MAETSSTFIIESQPINHGAEVEEKHESTSPRPVGPEPYVSDFNPGAKFWWALAPILILAMMVSLDGTSVSVALPIISKDLKGTSIEAFWTGTSFLLASAVLQAPMGIGGGGIILLNDIIITDLVPMRERGKYFGIIGGIWALGSVTGPVIGGALALKAGWQWLFWINVPFAAIALFAIPFCLRLTKPPGAVGNKLKHFDWLGSVFFVGAATCFLMPLTWGGVQYSWSSWRTLFPLLLGAVALVGFCLFERYVSPNPIVKLQLLNNYEMGYSLVAAVINAAIVYGALYFLLLYFLAVRGYNPIVAGVALFPATFTVAPLSIVAGVVITKRGEYRWVTWIGWIISTLGLGVMILLDVNMSTVQWFFLTLTTGIGLGLLYTSLAIINQAASRDELMSFAISMFIFARMLGQCLGVAISGVVFQNQMRSNLLKTTLLVDKANEYSRDASSIIPLLQSMADGLEKTELVQAYADSLKIVWAVMCALSGIAMIGSFFLKHISLDREHKTEQGIDRKQ